MSKEKIKLVAIVQARMTSERLPGKVLMTVLEKPLLEYQIERLKRVKLINELVIATTENKTDDPIVGLCSRLSISFFRGSEHDVLSRYYDAAVQYGADVVTRITSDCPLIDPAVIDQSIQFFLDHRHQLDYVSNVGPGYYPRGMDCEVFSFRALKEAFQEATEAYDREHVTPFIAHRPQRFKSGGVPHPIDLSHHRWTVDTPDDFELIRRILTSLYPSKPEFTLADIIQLLEQHPDWQNVNAHVKQKANPS